MTDMTQLTGDYAISWLPWIMIPLIFYILPFPIFAIIFLWIEKESNSEQLMGEESNSLPSESQPVMGGEFVESTPL
ncbi:MAG: hypothetical protein AAGI69_13525 [Cyanobacteria bacterium P01_H01_bin.21]